MTILRLATRRSRLALWQANWVAARLHRAHPGLIVRLVPVDTGGDVDLKTPLYALGTIGVFAKEVHAAVLSGRADAGVHSCKDLPTTWPVGLELVATPERADPRDVLVGADSLAALAPGALLGTSSLRRQVQASALRPDLRFVALRGNVQTRLAKIVGGDAAATIMAMAGLHRLGLLRSARATPLCPWTVCTPAPAQGAVAIDCRIDDRRARRLLTALDHQPTRTAITIEREVLASLAGGCSLPLGCFVAREGARWRGIARLGRDGRLVTSTSAGPAAGMAVRLLAGLNI